MKCALMGPYSSTLAWHDPLRDCISCTGAVAACPLLGLFFDPGTQAATKVSSANGRLVDRSVAVEGLRAALDQRKATPAQIADAARAGGAWRVMRPYLEALTFNG